jgi:hypothetical protein
VTVVFVVVRFAPATVLVVLFCSGGDFSGTGAFIFGDVSCSQQVFHVVVVGNEWCFIL